MERFWNYNKFKVLLATLFVASFSVSWSLNSEGLALLKFKDGIEMDPFEALSGWKNDDGFIGLDHCSWFGVECSNGKVVVLNLRDSCLGGTLTRDLSKLKNVKSIILRNNSFHGTIPLEIGELEDLEVLDLGYNNFSGPFPSDLGKNLSPSILLLDNNNFLETHSEFQKSTERKLLHFSTSASASASWSRFSTSSISFPPSTAFSPSESPSPAPSRAVPLPMPILPPATSPPTASSVTKRHRNHHAVLILSGVVGGSVFIFLSAFGFLFLRRNKVVITVNPWATGLSGQLQKAFTTGVPSLQRPELVTACEDFSNIIGSMIDGTVYKGTLSSGVEIAVTSTLITSAKDWTKKLETQFRKKIEMLSKVNHKNFVNLIGYCEEQNPFTRMMVFEYAPNGTLFEHLHNKEAEHLDWSMRLRIAMGMAYCLEYLHQLNPPIAHKNLQSTSIYLTEDYAAKISDFSFWDATKTRPTKTDLLQTPASSPESNIHSFGVILYELITGTIPNSITNASFEIEQVDPSLSFFENETVIKLFEVVRSCVFSDINLRPTMREVAAKLKDITAMAPEGAIPRTSPLWWAELEILSTAESN